MIDQQLTLLEPLGATIPDAVALYIQQNRGSDVTVEKVVDELIRTKSRDVGIHHLSDIRSRLKNRFCADFGDQPICSITGPDLACWLDSLNGSSRSRRNFHSALVGLFKFAKEHGYLPENLLTAPEKIRKPKAGRVIRKIFSPEELKQLIAAGLKMNSPGLLPLLIQSFTGVRSEELRQTTCLALADQASRSNGEVCGLADRTRQRMAQEPRADDEHYLRKILSPHRSPEKDSGGSKWTVGRTTF